MKYKYLLFNGIYNIKHYLISSLFIVYKLQSMSITDFEGQKGTIRLLLYLYDKRESSLSSILKDTDIYDRIFWKSAEVLKNNGLVETRIDNSSYPPKNMISLTDKGKKVAGKLKEIEEIIEGQ